jgi:hypothetical protein
MEGATESRVHAVRWDFRPRLPFAAEFAIMATDRLRFQIAAPLKDSPDEEDFLLEGHNAGPATEARFGRRAHAHWLWIEDEAHRVAELALWVPAGLAAPQRSRVVATHALSRPRYLQRGYVPGELYVNGIGAASDVLADLGGGATSTVWRSALPYLVTLHDKRSRRWEDVVRQDVQRYLNHYHGVGVVRVLDLVFRPPERRYRTTRWDIRDEPAKAVWIERLEVDVPLTGPVCLGRHSHFGFGRFLPVKTGVDHD